MIKKIIYRYRSLWKAFFFLSTIFIPLLMMIYFTQLIHELEKESADLLNFQVKVMEKLLQSDESDDINFLLQNILSKSNYPIIYTSADTVILGHANITFYHSEDSLIELQNYLVDFSSYNEPIAIRYDSIVLGYYYYGEPFLIKKIKWIPNLIVIIIVILISIALYGFFNIKQSEENYVWVGMAKETAHQLGTPLSSISGWLELYKEKYRIPYIEELEKDLDRLKIVAHRFSLIGSQVPLTGKNISDIIQTNIDYFEKRQLNSLQPIRFIYTKKESILCLLNEELLNWVIENLIRNSMDAIEDRQGVIEFYTQQQRREVKIYIKDNGRGISKKDLNKIFKPGFTTKKRGWGLGLSLTKRIIEENHRGRIRVLTSHPEHGTVFEITLRKFEC